MAYVSQIGEFEDEGLGRGKERPKVKYHYYIKGKLVSRNTYFSELKKLTQPLTQELDKQLQSLNKEKNNIIDKVARENGFEYKK
jgi:hypothetical protein